MNHLSIDHYQPGEEKERPQTTAARIPTSWFSEDLRALDFAKGTRALEAGCGTGLLSRFLSEQHSGVEIDAWDHSEIQIRHARKASKRSEHGRIHYFASSPNCLPSHAEVYDLVVSRFAFDRQPQVGVLLTELNRVLKTGGKIRVIESDGVIQNLYPMSKTLKTLIDRIGEGLFLDDSIGRKVPNLLYLAGFRNIEWEVESVKVSSAFWESAGNRVSERFQRFHSHIAVILGSEQAAVDLRETYLDEMKSQGTVGFYNKFIVTAQK